MTRAEDVEAAERLGADAVGFVVYEGSPRRVTLDEVAAMSSSAGVERFLVTVDEKPADLIAAAVRAGVTGVQPHGLHARAAAVAAMGAGLTVLFPVPVTDRAPDLEGVPAGCTPMLDRGSPHHGGMGRSFDWTLANGMTGSWVLAGGLTPDTVGMAVEQVRPWGVDVASGVESAPGVKNHDLMRRFVEASR